MKFSMEVVFFLPALILFNFYACGHLLCKVVAASTAQMLSSFKQFNNFLVYISMVFLCAFLF